MPLFQYFGWVGSFLLAALFAANWCCSVSIARAPLSDVPLDQKINIRIHTDHKWPERVVFDTASSSLPRETEAYRDTDVGRSETPAHAELQPFDAFAEMAIPLGPGFRPPCSTDQVAEPEASSIEKGAPFQNRARLPMTARKDPTFPSRLRKPPGKS